MASFTLSQMNQLTDYVKSAKANTEGFNLLVQAHNQTIDQHNLLVDIALQQQERADQNYALYVQEFNEHQQDKTWFEVQKVLWQVVALLGLAL